MRASAGFDATNALLGQRTLADQELGILFGVNIIGHDAYAVERGKLAAQAVDERGFSTTHGTGNTYAKGSHRTDPSHTLEQEVSLRQRQHERRLASEQLA